MIKTNIENYAIFEIHHHQFARNRRICLSSMSLKIQSNVCLLKSFSSFSFMMKMGFINEFPSNISINFQILKTRVVGTSKNEKKMNLSGGHYA